MAVIIQYVNLLSRQNHLHLLTSPYLKSVEILPSWYLAPHPSTPPSHLDL